MKKILKRLLCLGLSAVSVFACFACNQEENNDDNNNNNAVANANHDFSYTETEDWLVRGGQTQYKIVMPEGASTELGYAKTELTNLFAEATGIELQAVTDAGLSHNAENRYISLGDTELFETSGLTVDKSKLTRDGIRIITKDKTIYIVGGGDVGVLYGVYDFLNLNFGFEAYYTDCYDLDTGVTDVKLMNYNVTDIPDIEYRCGGGYLYDAGNYDQTMLSYRFRRKDAYWKFIMPIHKELNNVNSEKASEHNSVRYYLPQEQYLYNSDASMNYPEFYSTEGEQLCYTARGDADLFDLMTDLCAEKIENSLKLYTPATHPDYTAVQIGIQDNSDMCTCLECLRVKEKYGAISATVVIFINEVSRKVNAWMELPENAEYARENFQYLFFVYAETMEPPYQWDEKAGKYMPADNAVLPAENVSIFLAVSKFNYGKSVYADENSTVRGYIDAWGTYFNDYFVWSYGGFIDDYMAFFDNYNFYEQGYAYFASLGAKLMLPQFHSSQRGGDTAFYTLYTYLGAKMMWDSSLDAAELTEKFFNAMYKDAAPAMKAVYNEGRFWFARQSTENAWTYQAWWLKPTQAKSYWTLGYIEGLFSLLDEAYAAIEKYKNDEELYSSLKNHIDMEWVCPAKVAIDHFSTSYTTEHYAWMKENFKAICSKLGFQAVGEHTTLSSYLAGF
ncbi:MAG: DUF4838 domain-containing protein [Clostridia bacterium]|nr:DUF4838 domain-containing protein [Clostridia bacterium]